MMDAHILKAGVAIQNRYEVVQYLDAGGMQEVFIAKDKILGRYVALKTPKNSSAAKRFEQSASMSARINNPYVARTFDYILYDDKQFLVEELVDGVNLDVFLKEFIPRLDPHQVCQIAQQFARGLRASHQVGVIHRDLKPNNLLVQVLQGRLNVKITDFGIAKLTEEVLAEAAKNQQTIQNSSTMFGALPFMSPELIDNPKAVSEAADIWSFGSIIYYLLSGAFPFGENLSAIAKIMSGVLPSDPDASIQNSQFKPLAKEIWEIIKPCFSQDPKNRPDASTLATQLADVCYCTLPRVQGVVDKFGQGNGEFGYITSACYTFFHRDSLSTGEPAKGLRVYFSAHSGKPHPRAHPIVPILADPETARLAK